MNKNAKTSSNYSSKSTSSPTTRGGKRSLPPPMTFGDFAVDILLFLCRKYVLFNINIKFKIYCLVVIIGSLLSETITRRDFYLSQKGNFFNVVFVKWCWGWTLLLVGSFVYLTAKVYSAGDARNIRQQLARLIVGTFIWFFTISAFIRIAYATGFCTKKTTNSSSKLPVLPYDRTSCAVNGGRWYEFDVSGHVFMLVYICLLIAEELRVFRNWDQIKYLVDSSTGERNDDPPEIILLTRAEIENVRRSYIKYTPRIRILFVLTTLLNFLFESTLIISTLYYHDKMEKLVALFLAVFFWWITYRVWYTNEMSPGLPGHCKIKYSKDRPSSASR